jgi:hypothetical protein
MSQSYNQPTNIPDAIGANASAIPTDGRTSVEDDSILFCTKDIQIIGVHLGYAIGTFSNKDGSGGLFITDGQSTFNIDENKTIHLQTGKSAIDGATGGGIQTRSDWFHSKMKEMTLEVTGVDDESTQDALGTEERNPAFSLKVYGDATINCVGGDLKIGGNNILIKAEDQLKLVAGSQILAISSDGTGKIDLLGGEVKTTAKFAKFDLTGSFYVDGPSEVTFNQKLSVDPITSKVTLTPTSSSNATNSIGNITNVVTGQVATTTIGNTQIDANKFLTRDNQGSSTISLGPNYLYSLAQIEVEAVGTPRENSRGLNAYSLKVGGSIGTSYDLAAGAINQNAVGSITSTSVSFTSLIGLTIQLN